MKLAGLEEHFVTRELPEARLSLPPGEQDVAVEPSSEGDAGRRLLDLGPERLAMMDDAGVDIQVLSVTTPGPNAIDRATAAKLADRARRGYPATEVAPVAAEALDRFAEKCRHAVAALSRRTSASSGRAARKLRRRSCRRRCPTSTAAGAIPPSGSARFPARTPCPRSMPR